MTPHDGGARRPMVVDRSPWPGVLPVSEVPDDTGADPVPPQAGPAGLSLVVLLLLVAAGVAVGVGVGVLGVATGPLPIVLALLLVAGLVLGLRRPLLAVAAVPLLVLIGLRPAAAGAQVVQLLVLFALGCSVAGSRAGRAGRRLPAPLVWALGLALVALVSTTTSAYVATSLRTDVNLLLGIGLAWVCVSRCRDRADLLVLLRCFAVGALAVAVPALAQAGSLQGYYGGTIVEGRATGPFAEPNQLGSYSVSAFWVCCALVALSPRRGDRLLGSLGAVASAGAMLLSLSRGSWMGLGVGIVALVVLHPPAWRRVVRLTAVAAAALVLVLGAAPFSQTDIITQRLSTVVNGAANPDDRRDLIREEALRLLTTAPALGHGPGSFFIEAGSADSALASYRRLHAHNVLLQVGAELGLAGLAVVLALTASVARAVLRSTALLRGARRPREAVVVALLGSACVSLAAHGLIDVTFQNPVIMVVDWLVLGLLLATITLTTAPRPRAATPAVADDPVRDHAVVAAA